jgi:hypothetical protein
MILFPDVQKSRQIIILQNPTPGSVSGHNEEDVSKIVGAVAKE